jgi:hypothetical protein
MDRAFRVHTDDGVYCGRLKGVDFNIGRVTIIDGEFENIRYG